MFSFALKWASLVAPPPPPPPPQWNSSVCRHATQIRPIPLFTRGGWLIFRADHKIGKFSFNVSSSSVSCLILVCKNKKHSGRYKPVGQSLHFLDHISFGALLGRGPIWNNCDIAEEGYGAWVGRRMETAKRFFSTILLVSGHLNPNSNPPWHIKVTHTEKYEQNEKFRNGTSCERILIPKTNIFWNI